MEIELTDLEKELVDIMEEIQDLTFQGLKPSISNLTSREDWLEYHMRCIAKIANDAIIKVY